MIDATRAAVGQSSTAAQVMAEGCGTVLIAEDQPMLLELFGEILAESGYAVLATASGEEALAVFERHRASIDLLITDVSMPGMSGPDLVARASERLPQLKVLYVTGHLGDVLVHRGASSRQVAILRKPFDPLTLGRTVRELLSAR